MPESGDKILLMDKIQYSHMKRTEIRQAAEVAVQAFSTYEYFTNYFPEAESRLDFMRRVITSEYRTNYGKAHYLVGRLDDRIVAVADLRSPNYQKPGDLAYLLHGWWRVMTLRPKEPVETWLQMDQEAGMYCHNQADTHTWYLSSLTISPDCQGMGIGTEMLMHTIIPYIKQHGGSRISFFTNSQKNLEFYSGLGFEVADEREFHHNGHTMGSWSFVRELDMLI